MLKELPKLLDRDFVAGHFLPALAFVLAAYFLAAPWFASPNADQTTTAVALKLLLEGDATVMVLVIAIALSIVLMLANTQIIRIFEGYGPPLDLIPFLPGHLKERQLAERRFLLQRIKLCEEDFEGYRQAGDPALAAHRAHYGRLKRLLLEAFPDNEAAVLPTSLGNIIRAFEVYPRVVYGIEAIDGWYRLTAVIPESFSKEISGAKLGVDCSVNFLLLSSITVILAVIRAALEFHTGAAIVSLVWDVVFAAIPGAVAFASYQAAKAAAIPWGHTIKAAFDLYLGDLAKQLGYTRPLSKDDWTAISQSFIYWDSSPRSGDIYRP